MAALGSCAINYTAKVKIDNFELNQNLVSRYVTTARPKLCFARGWVSWLRPVGDP